MEIENRIVCFIDILGYKDIIEKFEKDNDTSIIEKIQKAFRSALESITGIYKPDYSERMNIEPEKVEAFKKEFYFKTFSDNIIISLKYKELDNSFWGRLSIMLYFSNVFQYLMLLEGIYLRGGISYGSFYSDENIIFSIALVKAYEIESKKAVFPRIVLDNRLNDQLKKLDKKLCEQFDFYNLLYLDGEETIFLCPFSASDNMAGMLGEAFSDPENPMFKLIEMLPETVKSIILNPKEALLNSYKIIVEDATLKSLESSYSEKVRKKYRWLLEFYYWKYDSQSSEFAFLEFRKFIN